MLVKIQNPSNIFEEITTISKTATAGDSDATVKNNNGFSANDYVVVGKLGDDATELRQVSSVSGTSTLNWSSTLSRAHGIGTVLYLIPYNQVEISRRTTPTSSWSVLATIDLEVDSKTTNYNDTGGQTSYQYRIRLFNSQIGQYTDYSPILIGTGFDSRAVKPMIDAILMRLGDRKAEFTSREEVMQEIQYQYEEIASALIQSSSEYYRKTIEIPTENFKYEYSVPDDFREIHEVRDGNDVVVPPVPRDVSRGLSVPGYEMTDRDRLRFNDVPLPNVTTTSTSTSTSTTTTTT